MSIPQGVVGLPEVLLETLDVTLPSMDAILDLPDLLGNLPNEPKVVAHQHHATVPVCEQEGAVNPVSCKHSDNLRHRPLLRSWSEASEAGLKQVAGCWGDMALLQQW